VADLKGRYIIRALQKRWTANILLTCLLWVSALTILFAAVTTTLLNISWLFIPAFFIVAAVCAFIFFYKKINETDVTQFLNTALPEMQESTGLLLKPYESLNRLQKLQVHVIEGSVTDDIRKPKNIARKLRSGGIFLAAALFTALLLYMLPSGSLLSKQNNAVSINTKPETRPAEIRQATVTITPPSYTGRNAREQNRFNVAVEENGVLTWHITTNIAVNNMELLFNDSSVLSFRASGKEGTEWSLSKQVSNPGFYQLRIGGKLSELYRIEMIKDELPAITVHSPKPNILIEPGESQKTQLTVTVTDDYGISNAFISATMASGNGEAVRFKEQKLYFADLTPGHKEYQLQKLLDLRALGMKPGDELYFYISATDTYRQEKRSDIFIVRIGDTTQLMSMEGLISGTDIKPEFFRSQRQIIIETEQLLRSADTITADMFRNRSNDLGMDQKLLRFRYSKFLGEETDADIGGDHDHAETGHNDAADFGNAQKMLDEIAHKHDNAEDASFFDAQTKKQLKATLDEMWKAELQLRTLKPKDALPFEYKALKLLKELQQQTRVYVGKTGSRTTPLKPEKRLTGELDKIMQPVGQQNFQPATDGSVALRKALGVLEQLKNKEPLQANDIQILQQVNRQLALQAAAEPSAYLSSYEALGRILNDTYTLKDISLAENALQRMTRAVSQQPQQMNSSPDMKLSQYYFMNLNRRNE
jgi:hypothetical protein